MGKFLEKLVKDVTDIKVEQAKHSEQLVRYNDLLEVHIARTEHLEERVKPIEDHVNFIRGLFSLAAKIIAILTPIVAILVTIHLTKG